MVDKADCSGATLSSVCKALFWCRRAAEGMRLTRLRLLLLPLSTVSIDSESMGSRDTKPLWGQQRPDLMLTGLCPATQCALTMVQDRDVNSRYWDRYICKRLWSRSSVVTGVVRALFVVTSRSLATATTFSHLNRSSYLPKPSDSNSMQNLP